GVSAARFARSDPGGRPGGVRAPRSWGGRAHRRGGAGALREADGGPPADPRTRRQVEGYRTLAASSASGERSPFIKVTWPAIASPLKRSTTVVSPLLDEST